MDMTKFEALDDPGFVAVAGELRRWVKELTKAENLTPFQSRAEGAEPRHASQETGASTQGRQALRITQGGSVYNGPTTVSGGSLFQGNYIG
jgi:hypothetical protein